jgi:oxalate decarboxylase/phosphoglucose isomerase-like protein (cupin superfamily)
MTSNSFDFDGSDPQEFAGGLLFRASEANFPALRGLAVQGLHLKPGAIREPHSHPNAEQLDYCIEGEARVGIVGPEGHRQLLDLQTGHISFVPQGYVHWIENIGERDLRFLVVLSHEEPETIELSETLAGVPIETLAKTLDLPSDRFTGLPERAVRIGL